MTERGAAIDTITAVRIAGPGREFLMDDEPVDIFIADGRIVDIAPTGALSARGRALAADGAWAVPGLWDNHVHTVQWALTSERAPLGHAESAAAAAGAMSGVPRWRTVDASGPVSEMRCGRIVRHSNSWTQPPAAFPPTSSTPTSTASG